MSKEILSTETETGIVPNQQMDVSTVADATQSQPVAPSITFEAAVGKDGMLNDGWRNLLPENIRGEKSLDSIKNFSTLAQSYVHAQKSIGANKVAIPSADATPEELEEFHKALGRPDSVEGYQFDAPKDLPEGVAFDDGALNEFKAFAFKRGWSNEEAKAAVEFQTQMVMKQHQAAEAAAAQEFTATEAKLRTEFGNNFDSVIAQCNQTVKTFGIGQTLRSSGLLNNYDVIKMLAKIGGSLSESKLKEPSSMNADTVQSRLDALRNDPSGPYWKKDHPGHSAAVAEVARLVALSAHK